MCLQTEVSAVLGSLCRDTMLAGLFPKHLIQAAASDMRMALIGRHTEHDCR